MSTEQPPPPSSPVGDRAERQTTPARPLSDEQYATFWNRYQNSLEAGTKRARRYAPPGEEHDVVGDAAVAMLEQMTRAIDPVPFPIEDGEFRAQFFTKVRDRAVECRRGRQPAEKSVHTRRAKPERELPARFSAHRPLWKIFDSLDDRHLDVAEEEPESCAFVVQRELHPGLRRYPPLDWNTYNWELVEYVNLCVYTRLPLKQAHIIIGTYFDGMSRQEVAEAEGISEKTYDTQHRRALDKLRPLLAGWQRPFDPYDENPWPEIIRAMHVRWQARQAGGDDGEHPPTDARRAA